MEGLLGKKVGMTQVYAEDGRAIPVTVIEAGPCVVVQRKTAETDGYEAVQIGLVEARVPRKVTQPMRGHFKKAGVDPVRSLVEVAIDPEADPKPGDSVRVGMFARDRFVNVIGTSKGKGFQGVMKRHGFGGGRASHGSMFHRAPGSVGQSASPSRVFPGVRLPGHMGDARSGTKNLEVVRVVPEENLLFVKGSVPGGRNGLVLIERALKGRGEREPAEGELEVVQEVAAEVEEAAEAAAPEAEAPDAEAAEPAAEAAPEDSAANDADGEQE